MLGVLRGHSVLPSDNVTGFCEHTLCVASSLVGQMRKTCLVFLSISFTSVRSELCSFMGV